MKKLINTFRQNAIACDILLMIIIITLFSGVFLYWGNLKSVNFCDEIYTYILSNSDSEFLTFQLEPGRWYENGETIHILSAENGFRFNQVMLNNKGDVHPPMYYFVIHILSVINAGSCSKWIGLAANWCFAVVSLIILYALIKHITGKRFLSLAACFVYISSPAVISTNMFLRMYGMFSMWVLLFVYISYWLYQEKAISTGKRMGLYAALAAVTFFGFLTQYYFAVFCVIFTFFFCLYKLVKKQWKTILFYIGSLVAAVAAATVFWKTWVRHMFSGYLGGSVLENAFNFTKIIDDVKYGCIHLFTLMYNRLGLIAGLLLLAAMIYMLVKKDKRIRYVFILIVTAVGYSIAVVHLTPAHLLSYRYFFPVTVIAYLAAILAVYCLAEDLFKEKILNLFGGSIAIPLNCLGIVFCLVLSVLNFIRPVYDKDAITYVDTKGSYAREMEILDANKDLPWIYFGYENATMTELLYDSTMSAKFIMVNYDFPFVDDEYTKNDCEVILFVETGSYFEEDAFTNMKQWFEGELEFELLTNKGFMSVYKVTHTVKQGEN